MLPHMIGSGLTAGQFAQFLVLRELNGMDTVIFCFCFSILLLIIGQTQPEYLQLVTVLDLEESGIIWSKYP
jgi:hypothetical protein